MRTRFFCFILFFLCLGKVFAQQKAVLDSLKKLVPAQRDTVRATALISVSRELVRNNPAEAKKYIDEALSISNEFNYVKGQATCYLGYGLAAYYSGDFETAEKNYYKAMVLAGRIHNVGIQARCFINLGVVNDDRGNYEKAIAFYFKGLDLSEKIHDENNASHALNNIGIIYENENKPELALLYYRRSLEKMKQLGNKWGVASSLTNIGLVFKKRNQMDSSLIYYNQALELREELADTKGLALVLNNIGSVYLAIGKYGAALPYFEKALALSREAEDKHLLCIVLNNMSDCSLNRKDFSKSIAYLDTAYALAGKIESKDMLMGSCQRYCNVFKAMKKFDLALQYEVQYSGLKDSVFNATNQKAIFEMQQRYESEKKEREIDSRNADSTIAATRLKHDRALVLSLGSGVLLFFLFVGLIYNRGGVKKKSNTLLEAQNELIRIQKEEITDSISYALNIQKAMFPSEELLTSVFSEHFILHQPKDIVSGDFYFVERAEDYIVFSAIDCTGHGVPGAFLSFLGMDILQDAVHRKGLLKPADILAHLDTEINIRLRQSSGKESIHDGMDLALCTLNLKTKELQYAGAFNPLYCVSSGVFTEIKADKHAIGANRDGKPVSYTNHVLNLKTGDCIYVLSDGYADQFGGASGKKFKYKPLKELILKLNPLPMNEQKAVLNKTFQDWKGDLFQVDDILILGLRI